MSRASRIRELEEMLAVAQEHRDYLGPEEAKWRTRAQVAEARIENARRYVEFPGNWSTYDGRRHALLGLLGGRMISSASGERTVGLDATAEPPL